MSKNKIIEILRSGDFTIAYHDSGEPTLYKGHYKYDNLPTKGIEIEPDYNSIGYVPPVVELLVKALQGKTDSI